MQIQIDRLHKVLEARGRRRSAHYKDIQDGLFTRPIRIGRRAVGWPRHETQAINAARVSGKSDDEIRAIVAELHAARSDEGLTKLILADVAHGLSDNDGGARP